MDFCHFILGALFLHNFGQCMQNLCPEVLRVVDVSPEMLSGKWYEVKRAYFPPESRQSCNEFYFDDLNSGTSSRKRFRLEVQGVLPFGSRKTLLGSAELKDDSFLMNSNTSFYSRLVVNFDDFHPIDVFVMDYVVDKYMVLYSCWQIKASIFGYGYIIRHYAWILSRQPVLEEDIVSKVEDDLIGQVGSELTMYKQYGFRFNKCLVSNGSQIDW
ncbi:uncharacterized protein LOC142338015 [Convolutriloba macropyga]|uniref:uncharacterized protein LOC142338015 n=1 Tax=Convolutriloba macropyga TaxID=536237 RepID=UPI003F526D2C